ncbi:MAG: 50S ribosomal protein L23 [Crocinitomicaceae bacterium]
MNSIIKKPILTEKATLDSELNNRFSFVVDRKANKLQIKSAVEELYGVTVDKVRTANYGGGKAKRKHTAKGVAEQTQSVWKKAIITVAEGETIDLYENI